MNPIEPVGLTIEAAEKFSGLSRSRLYVLFAAGKLHPRRAGRRTIIMADELRAYLDSLPPAPVRVRRPNDAT